MKNKKFLVPGSLLLITAIFVAGLQIGLGTSDYTQGNLLKEPVKNSKQTSFRDDLQLNAFNIYGESGRSLGELLDVYRDDIIYEGKQIKRSNDHVEAMLSYVHRLKNASADMQAKHLPMYPQYNVMTFELAAFLNLPESADPFQDALNQGIIKPGAKRNEFMSPFDYFQLSAQTFYPGARKDASKLLLDSGIVKDLNKWKSKNQQGFLVTEGMEELTFPLVIHAEVEALLANAQRSVHMELPEKALVLSDESLAVLVKAAGIEKLYPTLREKWAGEYGSPFSAPLAAKILVSAGVEELTKIPESLYLGDCSRSLYRKLNLGSLALVGSQGSTITCLVDKGIVRVYLKPATILVNANALPVVQSLSSEENPGSELVFVSFSEAVDNMLILGDNGEKRLHMSFEAFDKESHIGNNIGVYAETDTQNFPSILKEYDEDGIVNFYWPLRNLTGSNLRFYVRDIVEEDDL
jgi:hypothetical protein